MNDQNHEMQHMKRHYQYFIALMIFAFIILAYIILLHLPKNIVVELTNENLLLDGENISTLITNPKDGFPDFPKNDYDTFNILPLKMRLQNIAKDSAIILHIRIPDSQLYGVWKPLIITAQNSGFKNMSLECERNNNYIFNFKKSNVSVSESIRFYDKYDTTHQRASVFVNPDSIIVRRSNLWPYTPSQSIHFKQDSILDSILLQNEIRERISVIKSNYSTTELTTLVDAVKRAKLPNGRIDLQIHAKSSCLEIVKFINEFDDVWKKRTGSAVLIDYYDYFLKFRINNVGN